MCEILLCEMRRPIGSGITHRRRGDLRNAVGRNGCRWCFVVHELLAVFSRKLGEMWLQIRLFLLDRRLRYKMVKQTNGAVIHRHDSSPRTAFYPAAYSQEKSCVPCRRHISGTNRLTEFWILDTAIRFTCRFDPLHPEHSLQIAAIDKENLFDLIVLFHKNLQPDVTIVASPAYETVLYWRDRIWT